MALALGNTSDNYFCDQRKKGQRNTKETKVFPEGISAGPKGPKGGIKWSLESYCLTSYSKYGMIEQKRVCT